MKKRRRLLSDGMFGFVNSLPVLIIVFGIFIYPIITVIIKSFQNQKIVGSDYEFIGFTNYYTLINDMLVQTAFSNSVTWTVGNTIAQTIMGFVLALLLFYPLKKYPFTHPWMIIPWVVPTIVMALMWKWILAASYGVAGYLIVAIGLASEPPNFFGTPDSAMTTMIALNSWRWFPFIGILIYAALQNVPKEEYEAASLEGANFWQEFRYVTIPNISKTLFVMGLLGILFSFNVFDVIYLITKGGPVDGTTTMPVLIYKMAFENYQMSKAATVSVFTLILLVILVTLYLYGGKFLPRLFRPVAVIIKKMMNEIHERQAFRYREKVSEGTKKQRQSRYLSPLMKWLLVAMVVFIIISPFYWIFTSSLQTQEQLYNNDPQFFPDQVNFLNYVHLFTETGYWVYLKNSLIVSLFSVLITTILSVHTAYAISRYKFFGRSFVKNILLVAYLFPNIVLLVPLFQVMKMLGLIDSLWSLILINVAFTTPLATWLLDTYLSGIPKEVEEAAEVEGAGRLSILYRVVVPLLAPGIGSVVLFTLITSWSEYTYAITFLMSSENMTLPAGLSLLLSTYNVDWSMVSTGAVMTALPIIFIFLLLGRTLIKNVTQGAIK